MLGVVENNNYTKYDLCSWDKDPEKSFFLWSLSKNNGYSLQIQLHNGGFIKYYIRVAIVYLLKFNLAYGNTAKFHNRCSP